MKSIKTFLLELNKVVGSPVIVSFIIDNGKIKFVKCEIAERVEEDLVDTYDNLNDLKLQTKLSKNLNHNLDYLG